MTIQTSESVLCLATSSQVYIVSYVMLLNILRIQNEQISSQSQLMIIQMHNYKGQLRRELHDNTPTKSSWERERDYQQPPKYEPRPDNKYETKQDEKYDPKPDPRYDPKYDPRYDSKYQKSELSYYQSQGSRVVYDYDRSEKPSMRSQAYFQDDKFMFNELMNVRIKSTEREEYEQKLRVQINSRSEKGYSVLSINLTDDTNPKFLWNFSIRQGDFMNLKNDQKLKVSYASFPEMLENCFRQCQQGGQTYGEAKHNHLMLEIRKGGEGTLYVLQSNRYKESVHLYLHFKLANDEQIKDHLSSKLIAAQDEISKNRAAMSNLQTTLSQRMHEIHSLTSQVNELKKEGEKRLEQIRLEQKRKMNELESKSLNQASKIKKEAELELKQLKSKLGGEVESLTKNKNELMNKLTEARQKIASLQSNQREQTIRINRLEQDMNKYLKEYEIMKAENKDLSDKRFQNQKTITELTCKIDSLRSEIEDKKTIINSTVQLKENNSNQISTLQQQNNEQKKQIVKLETKITELEGQISKLNACNGEALEKIARQKEKLQERAEIIKEQEKQVKELKKIEATFNRENQDLKFRNSDKDAKIKSLQEQLDIVQKKLQEETSMVVYLQKSLNERPALRTTPYYSNIYQPTPPYSGVNRELPSQLSANSNVATSRVALSTNNIGKEKPVERTDKYQPTIKRYEQRSKSPLPKRLTQQRQPQQEDNGMEKSSVDQPRPVKFKMSQPRQ